MAAGSNPESENWMEIVSHLDDIVVPPISLVMVDEIESLPELLSLMVDNLNDGQITKSQFLHALDFVDGAVARGDIAETIAELPCEETSAGRKITLRFPDSKGTEQQ